MVRTGKPRSFWQVCVVRYGRELEAKSGHALARSRSVCWCHLHRPWSWQSYAIWEKDVCTPGNGPVLRGDIRAREGVPCVLAHRDACEPLPATRLQARKVPAGGDRLNYSDRARPPDRWSVSFPIFIVPSSVKHNAHYPAWSRPCWGEH